MGDAATAVQGRSVLTRPAGRPTVFRAYEYFWTSYKRTWRGTLTTSFLYPLMYLLAMGIGLGHLVNQHLGGGGAGFSRLGGVGYVTFIAPGLLAATAMQMAANEATYPVMEGIKWYRTYFAMLATPIRAVDIERAHLLWMATRVGTSGVVFLSILAAFGDVRSPLAVFAVLASTLTGMAFAAPITAYSVTREKSDSFALLYRMAIIPLFLFSGTFFPIQNLPGWLQLIARITPLYHGVSLCRALVLGVSDPAATIGDAAYLTVLLLVGLFVGERTYRKRLER